MYAAPIPDPNPESELSLAAIEATISQVASNLDARFVSAGEALAQAYAIVERLVSALEGVTNALGRDAADAAVDNMRATADRLERLPAVQAARQAGLESIAAGARPLAHHIAQVKRTLDFLRICGLNIKVAAAGRNGFADFADTMNVRLDVGENEIGGIGIEIERLTASIPALIEVDRQLAAECVKVIPQVPRKLAADAEALQRHQAADAARAARIAAVGREIHAKVATAIGAMQVGDITRQRLEHVAAGIQALIAYRDEADPATAVQVSNHMIALFAAQASDTIEAFHSESQRLAESLRGIAPSAAQLLEIKAEGDREQTGDNSAFLGALEQSVAEVAKVTVKLREADTRAQTLGGSTSDSAERLAQRLRVVHRVNHDVHLMAWNTDLRCHRLGDEGKALAMVAQEIRGFATMLATISAEIRTSVESLVSAVTALRDPEAEQGGDAAEALTESLACIRDGAQRLRDGLAGLTEDAAAVTRILETSTSNVDCEAAFGDSLRSVVLQLKLFGSPCVAPEGEVEVALGGLLDAMARSYTMAREREIHHRFALPGTATSTQPVVEDDDDDDGLF
jgi:methyl-accepting chemotaxis protein